MLSELGDVAVTSFYYIHLEINNDHRNLISSHWYDIFTKRTIFARNRIFFPANAKALPRYNNQSDFRKIKNNLRNLQNCSLMGQ